MIKPGFPISAHLLGALVEPRARLQEDAYVDDRHDEHGQKEGARGRVDPVQLVVGDVTVQVGVGLGLGRVIRGAIVA